LEGDEALRGLLGDVVEVFLQAGVVSHSLLSTLFFECFAVWCSRMLILSIRS
jgi:hypothetical protein